MQDTRYAGQIDSLRAFAVIAVLAQHFWFETNIGSFGVRLFFVISGFLITGILLNMRDTGGSIGAFYARRALRILPAYYALLAIGWLLDLQGFRQWAPWHAIHLSNVLFTLEGNYSIPWWTSHFWSLSVEEQFYLFWPVVMFLVPRRALAGVIVAFIAIGVMFRLKATTWLGLPTIAAGVLPPAAFDALCLGALLALLRYLSGRPLPPIARGVLLAFGAAGLAVVVFQHFSPLPPGLPILVYLEAWGPVLGFAALVDIASTGSAKPAAAFNWRPMQALGRISYGVYLYHLPLAILVDYGCRSNGLSCSQRGLTYFLLASALTITVAALSWFVFERPINELKRHFPYGGKARSAVPLRA